MTAKKLRDEESLVRSLEEKKISLENTCERLRQEIISLKAEIQESEVDRNELMRWRAKEATIVRHLKAVKNVVRYSLRTSDKHLFL